MHSAGSESALAIWQHVTAATRSRNRTSETSSRGKSVVFLHRSRNLILSFAPNANARTGDCRVNTGSFFEASS